MRRAALLLAMVLFGTAGCAAVFGARSPDPRTQLREGVEAMHAQQYLRGRGLLEPLYYQDPTSEVAQEAMVVLIAAELDNRNPDRRLWAAADMAARLLQLENPQPWVLPVAETYYLVAMELGAAEERIARAESARAAAEARVRSLPESTRESVPARISRVSAERDQARRRADQLEQQLATRDRELRETKQELDRIRRTIKP
jgi:outer membrane protein assembly factor BamD (BamD/ComL family)